jgi:hypothetical protein
MRLFGHNNDKIPVKLTTRSENTYPSASADAPDAHLPVTSLLASLQKKRASASTCGKQLGYPQERMCRTASKLDSKKSVQLSYSSETSFVQQVKTTVNH